MNQRERREYHDQRWRAAKYARYTVSRLDATYSNGNSESRCRKGDVDKPEEQRNVDVRQKIRPSALSRPGPPALVGDRAVGWLSFDGLSVPQLFVDVSTRRRLGWSRGPRRVPPRCPSARESLRRNGRCGHSDAQSPVPGARARLLWAPLSEYWRDALVRQGRHEGGRLLLESGGRRTPAGHLGCERWTPAGEWEPAMFTCPRWPGRGVVGRGDVGTPCL